MAKKIYIKNGVNLDSSITVPGYKIVGYNDTNYLSNLSEKNDLGDIREIGGGSSSVVISGNGVTASGTINYVSKFTDTNILGDSIIYDDGTNVGIGTASPSEVLHVYKAGFNQANVLVESDTYYASLKLNTFKSSAGTSGGSYISLQTTGTELLKIGTNTANSNALIESKNGYNLVLANAQATGMYMNFFNTGSAVHLQISNNSSSSLMTLSPTGNLGIGSTFSSYNSATARLHVQGIDNTSSNYALKVDNLATTGSLFNVRNDGYVGIGTASSSAKLSVKSIGNTSGTNAFIVYNSSNTELLNIRDDGYNTIRGGGQSIGSYQIYGTDGVSSRILGLICYDQSQYIYEFRQSLNNSLMYMRSSSGAINIQLNSIGDSYFNGGNVGIGTASPNSKLHVYDGNIELSLGRGLLYNGYTTFTTDSFNGSSLLIGRGATGTSQVGEGYIALGFNSHSTEMGIAIGISSNVNNGTYDGIAIGRSSTVNGGLVRGVAIGRNATALHTNSWALGYNAVTTQDNEFNFGVSGTLHKYIFNGQVGIGTSSPTTYLHINATQSGTGFRLVDTTEGLNKVLTSDANGVGTWASIGSIGIGTTNKSVDTRGFTASVTETITHNLNSNSVIVQNYDSTGLQVIAGSVLITGTGSVDITFSQTLSNVKTIIIG